MTAPYINPNLIRAPLSNEFMSFQTRILSILHVSFNSIDLVETGTNYLQIIRLLARVGEQRDFANLDELANFIGRDEVRLDLAISSLVFRAQDIINSISRSSGSDYSYNVMSFPTVANREVFRRYEQERILLDGMKTLHSKLLQKLASRAWEDYNVRADNATETEELNFPNDISNSSIDTTDLMGDESFGQENDH